VTENAFANRFNIPTTEVYAAPMDLSGNRHYQ